MEYHKNVSWDGENTGILQKKPNNACQKPPLMALSFMIGLDLDCYFKYAQVQSRIDRVGFAILNFDHD